MSTSKENLFKKEFWGECPFNSLPEEIVVKGTPVRGKVSNWSRRLWKDDIPDCSKEVLCRETMDIVFRTFDIAFTDKNGELFLRAITGKGNEWKTITTLHSSALCAFLHFYDVENKPIKIKLDEQNGYECFDKAVFEYKMPGVKTDSSMDVVLQSEDRKKLLFLESKFGEFLSIRRDNTLKYESYSGEFDELFERKNDSWTLGVNLFAAAVREKGLIDISNGTYDSGLKQIVCHYIALRNWAANRTDKENQIIDPEGVEEIYFSELLFDFKNQGAEGVGFDAETRLNNYAAASGRLIETLELENKAPILKLNKKPLLYYRDIYCPNKEQINKEVVKFYRYEERQEV